MIIKLLREELAVALETYIYMYCIDKFLSNLVNDRRHAETELSIRKVNRMLSMRTVLFPDFFKCLISLFFFLMREDSIKGRTLIIHLQKRCFISSRLSIHWTNKQAKWIIILWYFINSVESENKFRMFLILKLITSRSIL